MGKLAFAGAVGAILFCTVTQAQLMGGGGEPVAAPTDPNLVAWWGLDGVTIRKGTVWKFTVSSPIPARQP